MSKLGVNDRPYIDAVAAEGLGVMETLTTLVSQVHATRSQKPRPTPKPWWSQLFRKQA